MSQSSSPSSLRPPPPRSPPSLDYLSTPRYSQSTYQGRVENFFSVIDPRTLLATETEIRAACGLLDRYKNGERTGITQEQIWEAKKLKDSAVHPDNGEIIFPACRFSAFVPANIPIVVGMLGSSGIMSTIFWQWMNQSYNVAVNYANRNIGKKEMSKEDIGISYAGAVVASCSIAIGLGKFAENLNKRPNPGLFIRLFRGAVPFIAVASAGVVNVVLMRRNELSTGISIKDEEGKEKGISVKAGEKAIKEVALTRVALPAPILLFPPLIMSLWDKTSLSRSISRNLVQVPVITACLWLALPLAIGLFPQQSSIKAKDLESQFQNMKDSKGNKIETFYFNKGL